MSSSPGTAEYTRHGATVQRMFGSIAHRYDLANTVLSLGIHFLWRRELLRWVPEQGSAALDLCTGTADLVPPLAKRFDSVVGGDFSNEMLAEGRVKLQKAGVTNATLVFADAMNLPFADASFDCVTVSFGVRNFEDLDRGLIEIRRVLKPEGRVVVLEFGQPKGVFGLLYRWYSRWVLPIVGGLVTGDRAAYSYLERTSSTFPCGEAFIVRLRSAGFDSPRSQALCSGLAYIYSAVPADRAL